MDLIGYEFVLVSSLKFEFERKIGENRRRYAVTRLAQIDANFRISFSLATVARRKTRVGKIVKFYDERTMNPLILARRDVGHIRFKRRKVDFEY